MVSTTDIKSLILSALPDAQVEVYDPNMDGQHFAAVVISEKFVGIPMIKQHRFVNDALKEHLNSGAIHALQLKTYTPQQWQQSNGSNVQFG
jgi:acid stress-induced BolA-like protein IbaG/YrbA